MAEIEVIRSKRAVVIVDECDFDRLLAQNKEVEQLRTQLSARLQQLEEIRQEALTWAMVCDCNCPACARLYEVIRDAREQQTSDSSTTQRNSG